MSLLSDRAAPPRRALPSSDHPGISDARTLPDPDFSAAWDAIVLPDGDKDHVARTCAASVVLRQKIPFESLPLHGIVLLVGPPGTGKTTLARGLADRLSRIIGGAGEFAYLEINPHTLASASLGRSQQAVQDLFDTTIAETAAGGPLIVLIDEVETIATDRGQLSFDANPADVHRAVDAALVGVDRIACAHRDVIFLATSNFPEAIDAALTSRADLVVHVDLPDVTARRAIVEDTLTVLADHFPDAKRLLTPVVLDAAANASEGLDGRKLRKTIAAAAGATATANPADITDTDLYNAIKNATEDTP